MSAVEGAQWLGQRARRLGKIALAIGGFTLFAAGMARSPWIFLAAVAVLLTSCALWTVSNTARNEQNRIWDDYTAGRSTKRAPGFVAPLIIAVGLVTPAATLLAVRIPMGCSVVNIFGLPWPPSIQIPIQIVSLVVAVVGTVLVCREMTVPRLKSASLAVFWAWLILGPIAYIVFFFSIYGDPGPTTCR